MIPFIEMYRMGKYIETESRLVIISTWEVEGKMSKNYLMGMTFF